MRISRRIIERRKTSNMKIFSKICFLYIIWKFDATESGSSLKKTKSGSSVLSHQSSALSDMEAGRSSKNQNDASISPQSSQISETTQAVWAFPSKRKSEFAMKKFAKANSHQSAMSSLGVAGIGPNHGRWDIEVGILAGKSNSISSPENSQSCGRGRKDVGWQLKNIEIPGRKIADRNSIPTVPSHHGHSDIQTARKSNSSSNLSSPHSRSSECRKLNVPRNKKKSDEIPKNERSKRSSFRADLSHRSTPVQEIKVGTPRLEEIHPLNQNSIKKGSRERSLIRELEPPPREEGGVISELSSFRSSQQSVAKEKSLPRADSELEEFCRQASSHEVPSVANVSSYSMGIKVPSVIVDKLARRIDNALCAIIFVIMLYLMTTMWFMDWH